MPGGVETCTVTEMKVSTPKRNITLNCGGKGQGTGDGYSKGYPGIV